jgi:predicted transcriptional regulator
VNKVRYFYKKEINFTKLGQQFNLSRQTISTKFKNLKELGLIVERDKDTYEVTILEKDLAALIPYDTLKLITDTLNENSISTYIYLLNNWIRAGNKSYQFTLEQIKNHIGICATTRSNDNIVTNILFVL